MSLGGVLKQGNVVEVKKDGEIKISFPASQEPTELKFEKVIVCSGPWTSKLFPELEKNLKVQAIPVTYWKDLTEKSLYSASQGFPVIFNARYIFKIFY